MERQPVSERVTRNRATEPAPSRVSPASNGRAWPLPWPGPPRMLQPLNEVWAEWQRATEKGQWQRLLGGMKGLTMADTWNHQVNVPTEHWGTLAQQLLAAETSDPVALDRLVRGPLRIEPDHLPKIQALMRKHLCQWPPVEGLDPGNVWALVCQPVQALNLVLVQGSPEAIGQALAQHLVVGTTPDGQEAALSLPGTAVRLTREQAMAASWAANESGLLLQMEAPAE